MLSKDEASLVAGTWPLSIVTDPKRQALTTWDSREFGEFVLTARHDEICVLRGRCVRLTLTLISFRSFNFTLPNWLRGDVDEVLAAVPDDVKYTIDKGKRKYITEMRGPARRRRRVNEFHPCALLGAKRTKTLLDTQVADVFGDLARFVSLPFGCLAASRAA